MLYTINDVRLSKAETAKKKLTALNPFIKIKVYKEAYTKDNALSIIENYDIVADGTDNFSTRYLVNDACVLAEKVNVFASIFRFEGQVAVFNFLKKDGNRGVNYRDLHPEPPKEGLIPNCAEGGVLGVLPGIIGSMQANEVIKVIAGIGEPLVDKIFIMDTLSFSSHTLKLRKNPSVNITKLPEEIDDCAIPINEITAEALKKMIAEKSDFQLIDVREPNEYELKNIGGELIPLSKILAEANKINKTKTVVVHCQSGKRSRAAIELLSEKGFMNLVNLKGGLRDF